MHRRTSSIPGTWPRPFTPSGQPEKRQDDEWHQGHRSSNRVVAIPSDSTFTASSTSAHGGWGVPRPKVVARLAQGIRQPGQVQRGDEPARQQPRQQPLTLPPDDDPATAGTAAPLRDTLTMRSRLQPLMILPAAWSWWAASTSTP